MLSKFRITNLSYANRALGVTLGATLTALAAVALVVVSPAATADANCQPSGGKVECTFDTPGASTWTVPDGVTQATFEVFGASGGAGAGSLTAPGGRGGKASATFSVTPADTLQVNVGGAGGIGSGSGGVGGVNGGGKGGAFRGGGGGGSSDVRDGNFALADRIIVAGGGGGGGGGGSGGGFPGGFGGSGGGSSGDNGTTSLGAGGGGGGSATAGGSGGTGSGDLGSDGVFGIGGVGADSSVSDVGGGGGGGGGYYGGGGSGFVDSQGSNVQLQNDVRGGDGLVKITYDAAPATLTVTNTDGSGAGSLRQAITDANANANPDEVDTIKFDIPASDPNCNATSGVCTISPTSALPDITQSVSIDGYSQPGASPNTLATGSNAALKIELSGADSGAGTDGIKITGPNNVVKGLIINGWDHSGVHVFGSGASGNRIEGNYIGTDAFGTQDLGNSLDGITILSSDNLVGGTTVAARNLISGNRFHGVEVFGSDATGNRIEGNYIGTDAFGTQDLGNSENGVDIRIAQNNLVGGTIAAARNVISGNDVHGVQVYGADATGNRILRNSILDNGRLGIDLSGGTENVSQVTANDAGDADTGSNHLQNYPVITSATTFAGQTTIQGGLNSTPNDTFNLQFFASPTADPSGYGEGKTYVGQTNVTTNGGGTVAFSLITLSPLAGGQVVTAIATSITTDSTSEFSRAEEVEDNTLPPTQCSDGLDNDNDGKIDFGGTNGDPGCSSATDDSESPDPADTTSPTIISTSPTDGATGVARNANILANFSEPMKVSTITSDTFKLYRCSSTKVSSCTTQVTNAPVSLSTDGRTATLDPYGSSTSLTSLLLSKNKYKAVVTTGAQDVAGNPLDQEPSAGGNQEMVWYFTTGSR